MAKQSMKRLAHHFGTNINLLQKKESYGRFVYNLLTRCQSQWSKGDQTEKDGSEVENDAFRSREISKQNGQTVYSSSLSKYSSDEDDLNDNTWKLELDWITKALEPALQLCRRALPAGDTDGQKILPGTRSLSEIVASIQRSKTGIEDWSLSDLTVGLYLIFLRQASADRCEDIKGIQISSNAIVQDLIYHTELAKGAYKGNATGLARNSMLREQNVLKFIKTSSVMRPGYYIGIDTRNKLVILGIRGTHTVYDLITDIASSGDKEVTFEGYSSHFGTAEAARWFLCHEIGTLRKCLEKHEGYRLRIVGHSLGGAAAALLAIMLRKKAQKELGFNPDIVSAFGIGTPPCLSKELAESCSSYVSTVVMQDDIIPRLSVNSLRRLRNEILQTDWMTVLEQEDWKSVVEMVTNAKQVVSSVQGAARKFADYASFKSKTDESDVSVRKDTKTIAKVPSQGDNAAIMKHDKMPEELFVPGTVYFLKRDVDKTDTHSISSKGMESYTLWKRHAGEHFERIVLSSNLISDHKCDNHYYALRDVLKGLPSSDHD